MSNTTTTTTDTSERDAMLEGLERWINQRPGIDPRNYGGGADGWHAYRQECASVTRDLKEARILLSRVRQMFTLTADEIKAATRAYSGRLQWNDSEDGPGWTYTTGQYWPTEYRRAACAVLASILWARKVEQVPPVRKDSQGDWIRSQFKREFGHAMAARWFD